MVLQLMSQLPHGPFVMNTPEEIIQAIDDFQSGKMGTASMIINLLELKKF